MKIIAIGRNYVAHAQELNNPVPSKPVVFMKPDTALLKNHQAFYLPEFSNDIHHEVEVILKISKEGKYIDQKFAHKYFDEIGLGIDFTARDIQSEQKQKGLPWELAKAFDGSAPIGDFVSKESLGDLTQLEFDLSINGEIRQKGNTQNLIFSFDYLIAYISKYITLKKGDLIFTGTPEGVGAVKMGDRLVGNLQGQTMFDFEVK